MKTRNIINPLRQIFDSDRLAEVASTLAGNKSRTMLTAFGIFWGVFMLILLLGGGKGLQDLMMSKFGGFAENTGAIASKNTTKAYKGYSKGREWSLNMRDVENLRKNIKGIDVIVPMIVEWGKTAKCSKRTYSVQALKGIHPDQLKIETSELKYGRYINANDVRQERKVCVIGKRVFEELFPDGKNPCGKFITIDGVYYEVIGMDVRTSNISISGQSQESILIPYTVMRNILNYGEKVDIVTFTAQKNTTVASLGNSVRRVLYRAHNIHPDDKEALEYFNAETVFQMFNNLFRGINILVWLIGIGSCKRSYRRNQYNACFNSRKNRGIGNTQGNRRKAARHIGSNSYRKRNNDSHGRNVGTHCRSCNSRSLRAAHTAWLANIS